MLQIGPGVQTIEGITIYPDHADAQQFWYLPGPVDLLTREADGRKQFTFIKYKPAAVQAGVKGGGFLMFVVGLKLTKELERKIVSKLPSTGGEPRLTAAPFDDGTVQCLALNLQGAGGTAAETAADGSFNAVEKILGATVPSLAGDNAAAFSLTLSQEGATILEQAFEQGTTPIGVIYNLKFTALRPALDVVITADFKRILDSFSASLSAQVYVFKVGLDAAFEKLVQDGAIKIQVTNFTTDADRGQKEQWALDFFKDKLLNDWFQPSLTPGVVTGGGAAHATTPTTTPTSTTPATGPRPTTGPGPGPGPARPPGGAPTAPSPARPPSAPSPSPSPAPSPSGGMGGMGGDSPAPAGPAATGPGPGAPAPGPGAAGPGGPGAAPTTSAGPGAAPHGPGPGPGPSPAGPGAAGPGGAPRPPGAGPGASPAASGAGPATTPAGQAGQAAQAAQAAATGAGGSSAVVQLNLRFIHQEELKTVTFEYHSSEAVQRTYAPQALFGLLTADLQRDDYFVEVDLDDPFFRTFAVDVQPPANPAAIGLSTATVSLDYGDPSDAGAHKHADLIFDGAAKTAQKFEVFVDPAHDLAYTYRPEFHFDPDSGWEGERLAYSLAATTTEDRTLSLEPRDHLGFLQITVFPHRMDAGAIDRTEVELTYADPDGWTARHTASVVPGGQPETWKLRTSDPHALDYSYRLVHHLKDGTVKEADPVTTRASRLPIDDPFAASIEPEFIPQFPAGSVQELLIDVTYEDPDHDYKREESLDLKGSSIAPASLRIAILDPAKRTYGYRATLVGADSKIVRGPWIETSEEIVGVSATGQEA